MLMLSGIGHARELEKHGIQVNLDLPGVGKNLQDHLAVPVGCEMTQQLSMGAKAVFSADLKVKGIAQLRVADASVMPKVVSGNTNAAVIMISEKAADLMLAH